MEDLSGHSLRELLTLARERLGPAAAALKTREEVLGALLAALGSRAPETASAAKPLVEVVTRDFFRRRQDSKE